MEVQETYSLRKIKSRKIWSFSEVGTFIIAWGEKHACDHEIRSCKSNPRDFFRIVRSDFFRRHVMLATGVWGGYFYLVIDVWIKSLCKGQVCMARIDMLKFH